MISYAYQYPSNNPYYEMRGVIGSTSHFATVTGMAFLVPLIVVVPIGGLIADRFNRGIIICSSMLVMNLSTFLVGFATGYEFILATRILAGFAQGMFTPSALSLIVDYFPPSR